ncbi:MAG: T9SS type A sorting domain-containing protein [Dysgonomonas sp.]
MKTNGSILYKTGTFYVDNLLLYNTPLSIEDNQYGSSENISVYPNPASTFIKINLPENMQGANVEFDIISMDGKLIKRGKGTEISVGEIQQGTYILKISAENKVKSLPVFITR